MRSTPVLLAIAALGTACSGLIDGAPARGASACEPSALPAHPLRRLTADQYERMIARMFPGVSVALDDVPDGHVVQYGYDNDAELAEPSPPVLDAYHTLAVDVASAAVASPAWMACDAASAGCVTSEAQRLAAIAFRHPLDATQEEVLGDLIDGELAAGEPPLGALELAIQVILETPEFIYFPESAVPEGTLAAGVEPAAMRALSDVELANRLALFLWDEPADAALLSDMEGIALDDDDAIAAQVEVMLADPRADAGFRRFASQWMPLREGLWGASLGRNPAYAADAQLHADLHESAMRFLRYAFLEAGSVEELYTSRAAWVNDRLAPLFGIDPPGSPDALVEVELPSGERAGILTHPAVLLLARADAPYVSIHRGVMILHQVTCQTLGNPRFDLIGFDGATFAGTTRERLAAQHLGGCGGECHQMIDGAGFPFESYDALGRFRTHEGAYPIDASGNVYGVPTADTPAYVAAIADAPGVTNCLTEHIYRYALGTSALAGSEECTVRALGNETRRAGGDLGGIARRIATSDAFRFVDENEVVR